MTRTLWRSAGAVALGTVAIVALSLGTDEVLHLLHVYPPWGRPMTGALFGLATAYRVIYTIAGGYVTARFAPYSPVRHAVILGVLGLVPGVAGILVGIAKPDLGPLWYPVVLAVTGLPAAWLGGVLFSRRAQP